MNSSQRRSLNSQSTGFRSAINECVRYILYQEGSKIPIKRTDIASHLTSSCEVPKNEIEGVISGAETLLKNLYGYSLVKHKAKSGAQYIVVLKHPCEDSLQSHLVETNENIILNAALAHILMSGGSVKEEELWKFLIEAGLMKENENTVVKLLNKKFVSQTYLTCTKSGEDKSISTFEWGPRAHAETSKMSILQNVAKALGKDPEFWCEQFKDASKTSDTAS